MIRIKDPTVKLNTRTVVALGCFDGVHLGHAKVIGEAVRIARELGCSSAVWCFSEPPKNAYLKDPVKLICDPVQKSAHIRKLGADILIEPDFTREISRITARDFAEKLLFECAGAVCLVCGRNYSFGAGGLGNTELLGEICRELCIELSVVDDVMLDGVNVSSTLVRDAVSNGQCIYASKLLGRRFAMGFEHRDDGMPYAVGKTCFKADSRYLCPCAGEYEAEVSCSGNKKRCAARVSDGLDGREITLDIEVPYGGRVTVEFCSNKRPQKKA